MTAIAAIEGIGEAYTEKLKEVGINTVEGLLEKCTTPAGRKELAKNTEISDKLILNWANRADLARVKGIGTQYADLLEAAGVDTVPELAQRNPQNLHKTMTETNDSKSLVRQLPSEKQVVDWVSQAKALPRVITY